jgi:hypothetical protein
MTRALSYVEDIFEIACLGAMLTCVALIAMWMGA